MNPVPSSPSQESLRFTGLFAHLEASKISKDLEEKHIYLEILRALGALEVSCRASPAYLKALKYVV